MPGSSTLQWGQSSISVAIGEVGTVSATATSPSGMSYSVGDSSIATVSPNSSWTSWTITGVSAGTTTVTVTGAEVDPGALTITVTAATDDQNFLNERGLARFWNNIDTLKQDKLTAGTNITIAADNTISASQPTVGNATLTIQKNGTSAGTFTANATSNKTINITVPTTAADVSALPASTKYGASIAVSINTTDYKVTTTLKDQDGNTLGTAQVIDLPLESVVVNGSYDSTNKKIVLTLQNGNTIDIPVGDLVAGLQSEITSTNKLASDLVDDTNQTHKFMTSAEKTKLSGIAAGAEVNVQSDWNQTTTTADDYIKNKPSIPTKTSDLTNDSNFVSDASYVHTDNNYTTTDKNKLAGIAAGAEVNVQANWTQTTTTADDYIKNKPTLATVATSGSYNDLLDKPTLSDEIFFINVTSFSGSDGSYTVTVDKTYSEIMSAYQDGKVLIVRADVNSVPDSSFPASSSDYVYAELYHVQETENAGNTSTSFFFAAGETSGNGMSITAHSHIFMIDEQYASYDIYFGSITVTDLVSNVANPVSSSAVYSALATKANSADLAAVATSGSYNDLSNKPTIPAAQVNSDWNATSGIAQILNKPTLATVATSGSYNDLSNKPTIPTVNNGTLTIQKNGTAVATFTANQSGNATANITVPTIDDVVEIDKTLAAVTDWTNTGIYGPNLETGTYAVQVFTGNAYAGTWSERWSGIMSWYSGNTNSSNTEEILLHNAGHADNSQNLFLRTKRDGVTVSGTKYLTLQYAFSQANETTTTIKFSFRRII